MTIDIRPDPRHRHGGHAIIKLARTTAKQTSIVLRKPEDSNYLGPDGWQGSEHRFGPYEIVSGPKQQYLRLGPEIVNHMEPFLALEISLPEIGIKERTTWPENVLPAPDIHEGGGVGTGRPDEEPKPEPKPEPPPEPEPPAPEPPAPPPPEPEPAELPVEPEAGTADVSWLRRNHGLMIAFPLLLVILGTALWYWYPDIIEFIENDEVVTEPEPEPEPEPDPEPEPEPRRAECDTATIESALRSGTTSAEELSSLRDLCQARGDLRLEFDLCERLMPGGDANCLMRYGEWYDPEVDAPSAFEENDPAFERDLGTAAGYYKRAVAAGAPGAVENLDRVCTALSARPGLVAQMAVGTYCE